MDVPERIRPRLDAVLAAQPEHAQDARSDLEALTVSWDAAGRHRLLEHFVAYAAAVPLPAALLLALGDLLDD